MLSKLIVTTHLSIHIFVTLYTLNLDNAICQLELNKTGEKRILSIALSPVLLTVRLVLRLT